MLNDEDEKFCQHCHQEVDKFVDLEEETGDREFHGYTNLCYDCLETLEDELSDISHIIGDQSEEDFWDTINEDGPFGSPN